MFRPAARPASVGIGSCCGARDLLHPLPSFCRKLRLVLCWYIFRREVCRSEGLEIVLRRHPHTCLWRICEGWLWLTRVMSRSLARRSPQAWQNHAVHHRAWQHQTVQHQTVQRQAWQRQTVQHQAWQRQTVQHQAWQHHHPQRQKLRMTLPHPHHHLRLLLAPKNAVESYKVSSSSHRLWPQAAWHCSTAIRTILMSCTKFILRTVAQLATPYLLKARGRSNPSCVMSAYHEQLQYQLLKLNVLSELRKGGGPGKRGAPYID